MARALRIEYEGAWYHVMNRGAGRRNIFHEPTDRALFLNLLERIHIRYHIEIHAYCLMSNHYHLLLKTPLANLSKAIQHLNGLYAQRYNQLYTIDGPLFHGRFKSIVVDADNYLLQLSRYIHLNPVTANLLEKSENYLWSSYCYYLNKKTCPAWLNCNETLKQFTNNSREKYRAFVEEGIDSETEFFYKKKKKVPILGVDPFIKTISDKHLSHNNFHEEKPEQKYIQEIFLPKIEHIINEVAKYYNIEKKSLLQTRKRQINKPRAVAIYLAVNRSQAKLADIAFAMGKLKYPSISRIFGRVQQMICQDKILEQEIMELDNILNTTKGSDLD